MRVPFLAVAVVAVAGMVVGCTDKVGPDGESQEAALAVQATDLPVAQIIAGGNSHFHWLPPVVATTPSYSGVFDPQVDPTVRVCELALSTCGPVIAIYSGSGKGGVKVDPVAEFYSATWNTKGLAASITKVFRIEVAAGSVRLGYADAKIVATAKELKTVPSGYVGVLAGKTLNIKFRIETGIVVAVSVSPSATTLKVEETQQFTASVTDLHGNTTEGIDAAWTSSDTSVASITEVGLATGINTGSASISATVEGVTGMATVEVPAYATCVKPLALADLWYEANAVDEDRDQDLWWDSDEHWTFDPEDGDYYVPASLTQPESGRPATGWGSNLRNGDGLTRDYGRQFTALRRGTSLSGYFYYEWDVSAETSFREELLSCNGLPIYVGEEYSFLGGSRTGEVRQGLDYLLQQDPSAVFNPATGEVDGSAYEDWRQSPRVFQVPLFDPIFLKPLSGSVRFNHIAWVFLERIDWVENPVLRFLELGL